MSQADQNLAMAVGIGLIVVGYSYEPTRTATIWISGIIALGLLLRFWPEISAQFSQLAGGAHL